MSDLGSLFTLGYSGLRSADDLRSLLQDTPVDTIVDVRLSAYSNNRAFSTATRHTVEAAGMTYRWDKRLGNLGYKRGTIEIADISAVQDIVDELRSGRSVALLCVCVDVTACHRRVIADAIVERMPGLRVVHL